MEGAESWNRTCCDHFIVIIRQALRSILIEAMTCPPITSSVVSLLVPTARCLIGRALLLWCGLALLEDGVCVCV